MSIKSDLPLEEKALIIVLCGQDFSAKIAHTIKRSKNAHTSFLQKSKKIDVQKRSVRPHKLSLRTTRAIVTSASSGHVTVRDILNQSRANFSLRTSQRILQTVPHVTFAPLMRRILLENGPILT